MTATAPSKALGQTVEEVTSAIGAPIGTVRQVMIAVVIGAFQLGALYQISRHDVADLREKILRIETQYSDFDGKGSHKLQEVKAELVARIEVVHAARLADAADTKANFEWIKAALQRIEQKQDYRRAQSVIQMAPWPVSSSDRARSADPR